MNIKEISSAIKQICDEKNISYESVVETLNAALAAAYRKDFIDKNENINVIINFNPETGNMEAKDYKTVVDIPEEFIPEIRENPTKKFIQEVEEGKEIPEEEIVKFNPKTEILLEDAKKVKKGAKVGDEIITDLEIPEDFGRMAAQTAKQVIVQRLREAERNSVFEEFKKKEHIIITGIVQRREPRVVLIDLGKVTAIMPRDEQIDKEKYNPGERVRVYVVSVSLQTRGPEILVSRAHPDMLRELFKSEIPEVASGVIEITSIAREAGARSKVAVKTTQDNIDPIGSCVGQRGARIQTIINELSGEKIDIIEHSDDPKEFITNALSPAKIINVEIDEKEELAKVSVAEDQLSLAIGKEGQNVRLAAKLTGWKINILKETQDGKTEEVFVVEEESQPETSEPESPKAEEVKEEIKEEVKDKKEEDKKEKKAAKKEKE